MKKQLLLFFGLLLGLAMDSSAFYIVIKGGTRDHKFDYIFLSDQKCICRGSGTNDCMVTASSVVQNRTIAGPRIVGPVFEAYDSGKRSGSFVVDGVLPVSWKVNANEEIEITTKEDYVVIKK